MNLSIRRMNSSDVCSVKKLIDKTMLHRSMQKVYEASELAIWDSIYTIEEVDRIEKECHSYVIIDDDTDSVVACGYISLNKETNSAYIGMVFTDYEVQNMGLGKKTMQTLENDEYAKCVNRIELYSALSAFHFYKKLGYNCMNNQYDIEVHSDVCVIPMEKFV